MEQNEIEECALTFVAQADLRVLQETREREGQGEWWTAQGLRILWLLQMHCQHRIHRDHSTPEQLEWQEFCQKWLDFCGKDG